MKKNIYFFIICCISISCQNQDIEGYDTNEQELSLRSASSISEYNAIDQFVGTPVYIRKVGQSTDENSYLSTSTSTSRFKNQASGSYYYYRETTLDNAKSDYQKWILTKYKSLDKGDIFSIKSYPVEQYLSYATSMGGICVDATLTPSRTGIQPKYTTNRYFGFYNIPNSNLFKISLHSAVDSSITNPNQWLAAPSYTSNKVAYSNNIPEDRLTWEIIPVDEYEVIDIKYFLVNGVDNITYKPKYFNNYSLENLTNTVADRSLEIFEQTTTTSTISKTTGVKLTKKISASANIGIPGVIEKSPLNITLSGDLTREDSYTYQDGVTESKTIQIKQTISQPVKPFQKILIEILSKEYQANISYTATLKSLTTSRIIYLDGKWKGVIVGDTEIRLIDPKLNQDIKKITIPNNK